MFGLYKKPLLIAKKQKLTISFYNHNKYDIKVIFSTYNIEEEWIVPIHMIYKKEIDWGKRTFIPKNYQSIHEKIPFTKQEIGLIIDELRIDFELKDYSTI